MRLFARAVRRSGLDVAYSEGYNPRPRLSLVLPRPVGVASRDDLLVLELRDHSQPEDLCSRLAAHLPNGINISNCLDLGPVRAPNAVAAVYSLQLSQEEAAIVADRISGVLRAQRLLVNRPGKRAPDNRQLDIRPHLIDIQLDGTELLFTLAYTHTGSAKPAEILALLDSDTSYNRAQLVRKKVKYTGCKAAVITQKVSKRSNACQGKC